MQFACWQRLTSWKRHKGDLCEFFDAWKRSWRTNLLVVPVYGCVCGDSVLLVPPAVLYSAGTISGKLWSFFNKEYTNFPCYVMDSTKSHQNEKINKGLIIILPKNPCKSCFYSVFQCIVKQDWSLLPYPADSCGILWTLKTTRKFSPQLVCLFCIPAL